MTEILSVDNMRKSDAATIEGGISGKELMYKAGKAIYEAVEWKAPVGIVCGVGNNAGDGYVLARLLSDAGIDCTLILLEDRFSEDGRYYFDKCRDESSINYISYESGYSGISEASMLTDKENCGLPEKKARIEIEYIEKLETLSKFKTLVDCIFGTGYRGEVRGKAREAIEKINVAGAYIVSVDINSGLNGDSGMCGEMVLKAGLDAVNSEKNTDKSYGKKICVKSDITISIGSFKPGHFLNMAKDVMKRKINCDIGIRPIQKPYYLIEEKDIKPFFFERPNFSNKGTYGYTAIIGGSKKYSGAVRLAAMANAATQKQNVSELAYLANAAMRSGAGVVKVGIPNSLYHDLLPLILESTIFPLSDNDGEFVFNEEEINELTKNVKTVAFGMGIGQSDETGKCLEYLLKNYSGTLIVDADGLNMLSKMDRELIRRAKGKLVLTPHIKEFERLSGLSKEEILSSPIKHAEGFALDTGTILLLKGPSTIVTDGVRTYIVDAGCSGMATAGSGDVLSGILSAVCSYLPGINQRDSSVIDFNQRDVSVVNLIEAVAAGAYINGKAGELAQKKYGSISMIAGDTVACIPEVIKKLSCNTLV